jgi:uncharacterized protein YdaU (DUF1376 family)
MMHYYQFNIGDYVSHTRHLSPIEDIAYRRLLDAYYLSERPLNSGIAVVARQIGLKEHEAEVHEVLQEFFKLTEDGWINTRADKEIAHFKGKIEQASRAGKASAERRSNPRSTDVQPTNNHEPITINQKPVEKKQRGSRLPNKIENIQEWIDFCNKERPDLTAHAVYSQFRDYWIAKAGSGGVKLDWFATWRNWVRSQSAPKQFNNFAQVKADVAKSTVIESADYAATKRREAEEDAIPKNGPSLETLAKMAAIRAKARAVEI